MEEISSPETSLQELQNMQAAHFAKAIREGSSPCATGEDGLFALKVTCAAFESAVTGKTVDIQ